MLCTMTTITTCSNPAEAELLHSLLMENGIEAFVLGDPFGGAIHLQVHSEQAEEARRLLQEAEQGLAPQDDEEPPAS
jgi:hypothetical protein